MVEGHRAVKEGTTGFACGQVVDQRHARESGVIFI